MQHCVVRLIKNVSHTSSTWVQIEKTILFGSRCVGSSGQHTYRTVTNAYLFLIKREKEKGINSKCLLNPLEKRYLTVRCQEEKHVSAAYVHARIGSSRIATRQSGYLMRYAIVNQIEIGQQVVGLVVLEWQCGKRFAHYVERILSTL